MLERLCEGRWLPTRPGDAIEVVACYRPGEVRRGAVLFGPHPFLGGDMDNNVVRALARELADAGLPTLRFNYRSAGDSLPVQAGRPPFEYWKQVEEQRDHDAVLLDGQEALRRAARWFEPVCLVGYSFGAWVAMATEICQGTFRPLVLVAPPLGRFDFGPLAGRTAPSLLVLAGRDGLDATPPDHQLLGPDSPVTLEQFEDADHFFLSGEEALARRVRDWVLRQLSVSGPRPAGTSPSLHGAAR